MTERIGEELRYMPAITMPWVAARQNQVDSTGAAWHLYQTGDFSGPWSLPQSGVNPDAFAAILGQALQSDSSGWSDRPQLEDDNPAAGPLDDFSSAMLAGLAGTAFGGLSSPTLSALLGTDPRRIPWPSQVDEGGPINNEHGIPSRVLSPAVGLSTGPMPPFFLGRPSYVGGSWSLLGPQVIGSTPVPLSQFPRPAGDNGRGMHWIPTVAQDRDVVDRFVRELQEMKIKWAVILNDGTDSGRNDYLVQRLTQAGIMPVMRIYTPDLQPISSDELEAVVRHYRDMGVQYYQIYNEPNLRLENGGRDPDVSRYLDMWVPAAQAVVRAGGLPGFAALSPGGDVDDLQFLSAALRELKRRGQVDVLDRAWLSVHNYAGPHPIADTGDDRGFFRYRRYADIISHELGRYMPMIGTEGGAYPGGDFTVQDQVESVRQAYAHMAHREPYFLAFSHWIIANEEGGGHDKAFSHQALFRPDGVSPVVNALKEL